jgi:hypothetical protein
MIHLVTVVGSRLDLLPQMLAHYRDLGISSLLVNIHVNEYGSTFTKDARSICEDNGATVVGMFAGAWFGEVNPFLYRHSQRQYLDDWFVLADVDEFQVYPRNLVEFFQEMDDRGYDYVQGCVLDRISRDGSFPPVVPSVSLWDQYPLVGLITPHILKAEFLKVVAARGYVRLAPGQHYALTGMGCPIRLLKN